MNKAGYFDSAHKKPIPRIPNTIGVITSPTGAAIRDIINTISRRFPLCSVILYPAIVQGDDAKNDIVKQIVKANEDNLCDCLIVGRGGGSIEDLWAFNEKIVAYAIYDSKIPIISAVGHEIDFTIADFVADQRAATPTAAAELATPSIDNLKQNVNYYVDALNKNIKYLFNDRKMLLANIDRRIEANNPMNNLKHKKEILDSYLNRLNSNILSILNDKKYQFDVLKAKLESVNPLSIMDKGYSINTINNEIITDVKKAKVGDVLTTKMKNGNLVSKVIEVNENGK